MSKTIIILLLGTLFVGCNNLDKVEIKSDKNKQVLDSLSLEKANKTTEKKSLSAELDSLKKLRDSLNTISEK